MSLDVMSSLLVTYLIQLKDAILQEKGMAFPF
jgi:hypothetical protein